MTFKEVLEDHMDRHGLCDILQTLSIICNEKAEHVSEAWQDEKLAAHWERLAERLNETMDIFLEAIP